MVVCSFNWLQTAAQLLLACYLIIGNGHCMENLHCVVYHMPNHSFLIVQSIMVDDAFVTRGHHLWMRTVITQHTIKVIHANRERNIRSTWCARFLLPFILRIKGDPCICNRKCRYHLFQTIPVKPWKVYGSVWMHGAGVVR